MKKKRFILCEKCFIGTYVFFHLAMLYFCSRIWFEFYFMTMITVFF